MLAVARINTPNQVGHLKITRRNFPGREAFSGQFTPKIVKIEKTRHAKKELNTKKSCVGLSIPR